MSTVILFTRESEVDGVVIREQVSLEIDDTWRTEIVSFEETAHFAGCFRTPLPQLAGPQAGE